MTTILSFIFQFRTLAAILCSLLCFSARAGWTPLPTDIHDNLTGIVFWDQSGVLSGEKGIYYTLTGGQSSSDWQRFEINNNPQAAIIYNRSRFNHCNAFRPDSLGYVYTCGEDTILHKAIILRIHFPSLTYDIIYSGQANTALNHIGYNPANGDYYAVGENGLVVKVTAAEALVIPNSMFFNLRSIAIYNNKFWIGADGYRVWGTDISLFNPVVYPTVDHYADILFTTNTNAYAVGDNWYQSSDGIFVVPVTNFDFGPLDAQAIVKEDTYYFVATDHGIYRTTGEATPSVIEWQPTAGSFQYRELWSDLLTNKLYATGNDGVLMVTSDYGGKSKPFASMKFLPGACLHGSLQFQGIEFGTASTCKWYANNVLIKNGCATFSKSFNVTGLYHAELRTDNGTYQDTFAQDFYIVEKPAIDLPAFITDTTLCKNQSIEITLSNTQQDVYYSVFKENGNSDLFFGSSTEGDPGTVTFTSLPVSEKGTYFLRSSSSLAECHVDFKKPLPLIIELTKADFRPSSWNLKPGEPVLFFQNAVDAEQYHWTFSTSSAIQQSNLPNPLNSFSTTSPGNISLFVTSEYGCTDSVTKAGPTMYIPSNPPDPCWINHAREPDVAWPGHYDPDIRQIRPSKTGYYTCGQFNGIAFPTQHGDSIKIEGRGSYLAKYDFDGTVKWFVRSKRVEISGSLNQSEVILTMDEDEDENVYITGIMITYGSLFIDNSGQQFKIIHRYYVMKLDKYGKMLWYRSSNYIQPKEITIDHDGNLIVLTANTIDHPTWSLNGQPLDTLNVDPNGTHLILKISPDGDLIWNTSVHISNNNFSELTDIGVDTDNNFYIMGGCESPADFYSVGNPVPVTVTNAGAGGTMLVMASYNTDGQYQWGIRAYVTDILLEYVYPLQMVTDDSGNSYISGRNGCKAGGCHFLFENSDLSTTSISAGGYFIAKVNKHGICEWIQSAAYSFYGFGYGISLHGDEVSVLGEFSDQLNNNDVITAHMTSRTGPGLDLTITEGDYFIAIYDTSGVLRRLYTNGFNQKDVYIDAGEAPGMFQLADGSYYLAKDLQMTNHAYTMFGEQLASTSGNDSYVLHFDLSCAVVYWPGYNRVDTVYVCAGTKYTFPDGEERMIEKATIQSSHFTGAVQDSTIITNVKITEPLDIYIDMHGDTLVSLADNVQYQWLDCDHGYSVITGATEKEFLPSATGHYSVMVTGTSCRDTSACVNSIITGNVHLHEKTPIRYYPNPTSGTVQIDLGEMQDDLKYIMTDMTGKIVRHAELQNVQHTELAMPPESGMYILQLAIDGVRYEVIRIVRL